MYTHSFNQRFLQIFSILEKLQIKPAFYKLEPATVLTFKKYNHIKRENHRKNRKNYVFLVRAGQQVEIERTSFISFCDESEVKIMKEKHV